MREIPGRDGILFKYIVIYNDFSKFTPKKCFLDDYVNNTSLQGGSFTIDAAELHTFVDNLISQNEEFGSIIKIHEKEINGGKDWKALKYHYDGIGVYYNNC